jgi:hypothetical protein
MSRAALAALHAEFAACVSAFVYSDNFPEQKILMSRMDSLLAEFMNLLAAEKERIEFLRRGDKPDR